MAWGQYIEIYAFRETGDVSNPEDIAGITVMPDKEKPLEFAKKLRALAKKIEDAEKKYPGKIYIQTNY